MPKHNRRNARALLQACAHGQLSVVTQLLAESANPNMGGPLRERTPLAAASEAGHNDIVKVLIKFGADVNRKGLVTGSTALMAAAAPGHVSTVLLLLEAGATACAARKDGATAHDLATDPVRAILPYGDRRRRPRCVKKHGKHVCTLCGKVFSCASKLTRHNLVHSGVKPYECFTCGARFGQIYSLRNHCQKKKHSMDQEPDFDLDEFELAVAGLEAQAL